MMGFGGMGMALPWLFGGITVAAIWAGVFWLVASLGSAHTRTGSGTPAPAPPAQLTQATWQQPTFSAGHSSAAEADPEPAGVRGESATR